jgi:hypothetical protein
VPRHMLRGRPSGPSQGASPPHRHAIPVNSGPASPPFALMSLFLKSCRTGSLGSEDTFQRVH